MCKLGISSFSLSLSGVKIYVHEIIDIKHLKKGFDVEKCDNIF